MELGWKGEGVMVGVKVAASGADGHRVHVQSN